MRLTIAYGRVSTTAQADAGALERQQHTLLERAGADQVLLDVGSGTNTKRPNYQRMLQLVSEGKVERITVISADRLNRALQSDLELWALCQRHNTIITTLDGREIEFKTADGTLLSTITSALNQHRSQSYSAKVKRGLQASRDQGRPARSAVPFGLRLVRDSTGRVTGVDLDPDTSPLARERVDWFLAGESLAEICRRSFDRHQIPLQVAGLNRWLRSPMLCGRLCWHRQKDGSYAQIAEKQSFPALMTDAEADRVRTRLARLKEERAIRGRQKRMLSGICRCADCGHVLAYLTKKEGQQPRYLRCNHYGCPRRLKMVSLDQVFGVLQFSLAAHARAVAPLLALPTTDPPEVAVLQAEVETLSRITGTEEVVRTKQSQIAALRETDTNAPIRALIAALRLPHFWLQDDQTLNTSLKCLVDQVVVQLGPNVATSSVVAVKCRCTPAEAPLPADQTSILMPVYQDDLVLAAAAVL